ncbi:hypothetical protein BZA77DRAFT_347303 [Pyronema omphalodes]|nr:hypothetical protein BZA77DRAFT_347303 [Pyronema omphalodes]
MRFINLLIPLALTTTTIAAPVDCIGKAHKIFEAINCPLTSSAILPTIQQPNYTELTSPGAGIPVPLRVVLGHGTQNYTCPTNTSVSKPIPAGAKAQLIDASCLAAYPDLLHSLPSTIQAFSSRKLAEFLERKIGVYMFNAYIGDHFFSDAKTPVFSFARSGGEVIVGRKLENVPAPMGMSMKGGQDWKDEKDEKDGKEEMTTDSVDWLKISAVEGTTNGCKTVYRVVTAGGKPPATCEGQGSTIEVPYATEYWFY